MSHTQDTERPASRPRNRIVLWTAVVCVLLAAGYSAVWFATASMLRTGVERWIADRRAEGLTIATAPPALSGFPSKVAVRLNDVSVSTPPTKGGWRWHTARVDVLASPLSVSHISLDLAGMHDLSGGWIAQDQPLHLSSTTAQLGLVIGAGGQVTESRLTAAGVAASWPDIDHVLMRADKVSADVNLLATNPAPTPVATSRLVLGLENLSVPTAPAPLTPTLRKFSLTADVDGPVGAGPLPQVLEAWRSAGGAIDVKDFALDWPPLAVTGSGTAALDENLQPMGAFSTRISGLDSVIDVVVAKNGLDQRVAGMAKGVVGMLSQSSAGGGSEVRVSVSVQNRVLSIGPLRLLEVPPVKWPAAATP